MWPPRADSFKRWLGSDNIVHKVPSSCSDLSSSYQLYEGSQIELDPFLCFVTYPESFEGKVSGKGVTNRMDSRGQVFSNLRTKAPSRRIPVRVLRKEAARTTATV
jgi:hypothetical protein